MSEVAAACVCTMLSIEKPESGVEVPGVKTVDPVLVELMEGARSALFVWFAPVAIGRTGDIALRLGGETGIRRPGAVFEVLSMSGVRRRLGGRKGE
jgi:hypothetical protein